jgi:hypothetical protein
LPLADCTYAAPADVPGEVTVRVVDPLTEPENALMVVLPVPAAVAKPVLLIVATEVFEEPQVTEFVKFCVEPSL